MKLLLLSSVLLFALYSTDSVSANAKWNYIKGDAAGPTKWKDLTGNDACGLNKQSPIDIIATKTNVDTDLGAFDRNLFIAPTKIVLENTGHSLKLKLDDGYTLPVNTAGLPGAFKAAQLHFHWGTVTGSEHLLNGEQMFGEMHIVHVNSKYNTSDKYLASPDGLAVLGFFIKNDAEQDNANFAKITDKLTAGALDTSKQTADLTTAFAVKDLMPEDISTFYRYNGSLTTPTCNEVVTWTMFKEPIRISKSQGKLFQSYFKATFTKNYRPLQALNGRIVKTNTVEGQNSGSTLKHSLAGTIIMVALSFAFLN